MKTDCIRDLLHAETTVEDSENRDFDSAFASDLMSDALAMIRNSPESTVLITGLCNIQALNTAEMLDIHLVVLVRNKKLDESIRNAARQKGIAILSTACTMYEACGILYGNGLKGISNAVDIS
jgi:hypothetical protein